MGSENGIPSSMMSAPTLGNALSSASAVSKSGSPAVMKGTKAARFCFFSAAKVCAMRLIPTLPLREGRQFVSAANKFRGGVCLQCARCTPPRSASRFDPPSRGGLKVLSSYLLPQCRGGGEDVLVAAAGETDGDDLILLHLRRNAGDMRDGVRGFERGDDALELRQQHEGVERVPVRGGEVLHAALVLQPGMFRTHAGIVETGRDRMRFEHLAVAILQQIGA